MPWFKVDDGLAFHAKTVAAGNLAMGLWVRAGSWSAQQGTGGRVPAHMISALGATKANAQRLLDAGLWLTTEDGYAFHDWDEFQPSADEVRAERARRTDAKVAAGRMGGIASGVARRKHSTKQTRSNGEAEPKQNEAPTRPDPTLPVLGSPWDEEVEVELGEPDAHFQEQEAAEVRRTLRAVVSSWPEADPDDLQALA